MVIVGFIYGTIYTCTVQWNRYVAHPTVISLERDYRSWNVTLPAITLCYDLKVNTTKAENYIKTYTFLPFLNEMDMSLWIYYL